jgi:hypothetical protein
MERAKPELHFENVWKKKESPLYQSVLSLWKKHFPGMSETVLHERLHQLVFIVCTPDQQVIGVSTAFKTHVKHLRNNLYSFRCFIDPAFRMPGLDSYLVVKTRDWLESVYQTDGPETERCIGLITMVENENLMKHRNEGIWPASKMVYIGNSPKGNHVRVYYFDKALI